MRRRFDAVQPASQSHRWESDQRSVSVPVSVAGMPWPERRKTPLADRQTGIPLADD